MVRNGQDWDTLHHFLMSGEKTVRPSPTVFHHHPPPFSPFFSPPPLPFFNQHGLAAPIEAVEAVTDRTDTTLLGAWSHAGGPAAALIHSDLTARPPAPPKRRGEAQLPPTPVSDRSPLMPFVVLQTKQPVAAPARPPPPEKQFRSSFVQTDALPDKVCIETQTQTALPPPHTHPPFSSILRRRVR